MRQNNAQRRQQRFQLQHPSLNPLIALSAVLSGWQTHNFGCCSTFSKQRPSSANVRLESAWARGRCSPDGSVPFSWDQTPCDLQFTCRRYDCSLDDTGSHDVPVCNMYVMWSGTVLNIHAYAHACSLDLQAANAQTCRCQLRPAHCCCGTWTTHTACGLTCRCPVLSGGYSSAEQSLLKVRHCAEVQRGWAELSFKHCLMIACSVAYVMGLCEADLMFSGAYTLLGSQVPVCKKQHTHHTQSVPGVMEVSKKKPCHQINRVSPLLMLCLVRAASCSSRTPRV